MYENLYRFKEYPNESFASVIDRLMLNCEPSLTIMYRDKPKAHHINISTVSKDKLAKVKNDNRCRSHDEALWRVMHNDTSY